MKNVSFLSKSRPFVDGHSLRNLWHSSCHFTQCFLKCFPNVALFLVAFPLYPQTIVPILFKTEYWIFFWWDSKVACTISYSPTRNSGETRELIIKLLKIVKSGGDAMKKKKRTSNSQSKVTDNTKEQSRPMLEANMANIDSSLQTNTHYKGR